MKNNKSNFDYSDLKDLIDKMSKNEKRYFTVNSSLQLRKGESNFITLFKAFSSHPDKEISEIEKKIIESTNIKNLAETKYQLFNSILKNLHNYHLDSSIESEIQLLIHYIEITYSKSLLEIANKFFHRAWEKAKKNETFTLLLILLQWKAKLNKANTRETVNVIKKEAEVLKQLANLNKYNQIKEELRGRILSFGGKIKNKEDERKLKAFYNTNKILENEKNALSFTALCQHHLINSGYFCCMDQIKQAYVHSKRLVEIMREKPEQRILSSELQISNLQNAIIFSLNLKNFIETESLIKELENFKPAQLSLAIQKSVWVAMSKIMLGVQSGKAEECLQQVKEFEKIFYSTEKLNLHLPERYTLAYQIAHLYFITEQYKNCLKWLNTILNERNLSRQDITCAAQILFLITHYELKNDDYLPSVIINTQRLLNRKQHFTKTEEIFLKFFKKNIAPGSNKMTVLLMEETLKEIKKLHESDSIERDSSKYFDYKSWLKSKISHISLKTT